MPRVTKAINLTFDDITTSANISIPFDVRYINFKNILYWPDSGAAVAQTNSVYITSSLTEDSPIGVVSFNTTSAISTLQTIVYELRTPVNINGRYSFTLRNSKGVLQNISTAGIGGPDYCTIIAEFISADD